MRHYLMSHSVINTERKIWKKETVRVFVKAIKADKVMGIKCAVNDYCKCNVNVIFYYKVTETLFVLQLYEYH